jgi:hypothetical protein
MQNRKFLSKKFVEGALMLVCVGLFVSQASTANASAKKFKNCTELNKVYPGGVAKPGAVNKGGAIKKEPIIDAALYKANSKSDRDKDGIACEK